MSTPTTTAYTLLSPRRYYTKLSKIVLESLSCHDLEDGQSLTLCYITPLSRRGTLPTYHPQVQVELK
jgi:hypothetical protein